MRIERLEIDDLRSIKRLRWPEDGIGWGGRIPDVVVVAGANGSGKTTLLDALYAEVLNPSKGPHINLTLSERSSGKNIYFRSTRTIGKFTTINPVNLRYINDPTEPSYLWNLDKSNDLAVEEICYFARWEDANNFMNGRQEKATKFKFYADEFERFTEGDKKLVWSDEGELLVETRDGVRHDPNELSSGEHQALIFAMMLSRWWAPGSIVLIDEPELHMHTHWQAKLLQRIIDLQRERGGQAILATQSSDIYRMAPRGSKVQLGLWGSDD